MKTMLTCTRSARGLVGPGSAIPMLELAILGLLTEEPLHGYELKRQLSDTLGFASGVSFGSLYPALGRLEAAAAVRIVEPAPPRSPIPHTGSIGGELAAFRAQSPAPRSRRGKKVYGLTPRGRALFEELLAAESTVNDDDRIFALRLALARHLPADARLGMLERRRARLLERLARIGARARAGRDRLDGYGRTLAEHDRDIAQSDLSWIDQLIARERAAATPDAPATPTTVPAPISSSAGATAAVPSISAMRRPKDPAGISPAFQPEGLRPPTMQEDPTP
ncbi:MAG: PadR family transcriptional regulator [Actinomycetota bacterium]|nr:PadR family transcriptional regulator [Actinomycetota bacterium]